MTVYLNIDKSTFLNKLRSHVDIGPVKSSFLEAFSGGKLDFRGQVTRDGFKIRRKRRFMDYNYSNAIVIGNVIEKNDRIQVDMEINSFRSSIYFFLGFLIFAYVFISALMLTLSEGAYIFLIVMIVHSIFMLSILYLTLRRNTSVLKKNMEKELLYIVNK